VAAFFLLFGSMGLLAQQNLWVGVVHHVAIVPRNMKGPDLVLRSGTKVSFLGVGGIWKYMWLVQFHMPFFDPRTFLSTEPLL
jgi:hypothetical protein